MATPAELRAFALRDWAALAHMKEAAWLDLKRRRGPAGGIETGDALRQHVLATRPDWPTARQRRADHAAHLRLHDALARVPPLDR